MTTDTVTAEAEALDMVSRGFRVFPLLPGSRVPFCKPDSKHFVKLTDEQKRLCELYPDLAGGVHAATAAPRTIKRWFARLPDVNYAVSAENLCIFDVDVKNGKTGAAELDALGPLPKTLAVRTGTGGSHLYFRSANVGQRNIRPSIEIRSKGGYVVGPGSVVDGKRYEIFSDYPLAQLPERLKFELAKVPERDANAGVSVVDLDTDAAVEAAVAFLVNEPGTEVGERNNTAFRLACQLKDFGLSPAMIKEVMVEHWNDKNDEPLPEGEIEQVAINAHKSGRHAAGSSNPEAEFGDVFRVLPQFLAELEQKYPEPEPKLDLLEFPNEISVAALAAHSASAIVKGLCFPRQQGVIFGGSTEGKSFVAIDLAYHVALGREWNGMRVKRKPVLYLALEGQEGFRYRLAAASLHHSDPGCYFARLRPSVVLNRELIGETGCKIVLAAAKQLEKRCGEPVGLVFIDTLACAISGDDENAVADIMSYFTSRAGLISRKTGACTITVHHTNKEGAIRGSSAIKPTVDFMLEVKDGQVYADKIKDGVKRSLFSFELVDVDLGRDLDGDRMRSAVLAVAPPKARSKKLGTNELLLIKAFEEYQCKGLASFDPESSAYRVEEAEVKRVFIEYFTAPRGNGKSPKQDSARTAWNRLVEALPPGFGCGQDNASVPFISRLGDPDLEALIS